MDTFMGMRTQGYGHVIAATPGDVCGYLYHIRLHVYVQTCMHMCVSMCIDMCVSMYAGTCLAM